VGSFAAGLILSGTNQFDTIEREVKPVASVFAPIFFVTVGASVNLRLLSPGTPEARGVLLLALALLVVAVVGKVAAGWAAPWTRFRRVVVGVGMIPRGEVGIIVAGIGATSGVIDPELFAVIVGMSVLTTLLVPPLLRRALDASAGS